MWKDRRTDRHDDDNSCFSHFVNAPKNHLLTLHRVKVAVSSAICMKHIILCVGRIAEMLVLNLVVCKVTIGLLTVNDL